MSSIRSLSDLQSIEDFSKITTQLPSPKPLDAFSLSTIWATLSLLRDLNSASGSQLGFLPASLTLVTSPPGNPSSEAQKFLKELTRVAHETSVSLMCSSVLAGRSSESDDYGDVGFWLGDISLGEAKEQQVVSLLGLDHWLQNGGRIVPTETSLLALPAGLVLLPLLDRDAVEHTLSGLTSLISRLEQRFEFRLERAGQGGRVILFFVGRLTLKGEQAWAGLIGAGTWADE